MLFFASASSAFAADDLRPRRYAVLLGLDRYLSQGVPSLRYAKADVQALESVLTARGYEVIALTNDAVNRSHVLTLMENLQKTTRQQDSLLFFFAGHVVRDIQHRTHLMMYDSTLDRLSSDALRLEHLLESISDLPARQRVIILDVTFAGDIVVEGPAPNYRSSTEEPALARNVVPVEAFRVDTLQRAGPLTTAFLFAHHEPADLIASGHGAVADGMLRAFTSRLADTNRDEKLSVAELVAYLETEVPLRVKQQLGDATKVNTFATAADHDALLAELPAGGPESAKRIADYLQKLETWRARGHLSSAAYLRAVRVLNEWSAAEETGPRPIPLQKAYEEVAWHFDVKAPEESLAAHLERVVSDESFGTSPPVAVRPEERGGTVVVKDPTVPEQQNIYASSHALIIGVSNYTAGWRPLPGVEDDLTAVQAALEEHGFHVVVKKNTTRDQLIRALDDFVAAYGRKFDHRLLVYFAGHGHTMELIYGAKVGYIVPSDAPLPLENREGFLDKAIDMQTIENVARRIEAKHVLFVFDSCFAGTIFSASRGKPESISYTTSYQVRQFITSGRANEQVPDESIFRQQFVDALGGNGADLIKDGYLTGTELGEFLFDRVSKYSRGSQHPQHGKIHFPNLDKGDFVFVLPKPAPSSPTPSSQQR